MNISKKIAAFTAGTVLTGLLLFPGGKALAATCLSYGMRGSEVTKLQNTLKAKGFFNAKSTGYYGTITRNSVRNYQKSAGLAVDGIAGPKTLSSLYKKASTSSGAGGGSLLRWGSRGSEVTKLQNALKAKGYFHVNATGYYGGITTEAVKKFQRDHGLKVDGIAGPQTKGALYQQSTASRSGSTRSSQEEGDIYWLARIIEAEAGGESYQGKLAVGNVIMNRVKSNQFPNTIYKVIFEYYQGIPQFSPVADGTIYNTPSADSMKAARETYYGTKKPVGNALYFFNPAKAAGTWIVKNRSYITTIGGHAFYA